MMKRAFSLALVLALAGSAVAAPAVVRARVVAVEPAQETQIDPALADVGRQLVSALGEKNAFKLVGGTNLALSEGDVGGVPVGDGLSFEVTLKSQSRGSLSLELVLKDGAAVQSRMGVELGSKPFFANTRVSAGLRVVVFDRR